jgi:predicted metalloprotease
MLDETGGFPPSAEVGGGRFPEDQPAHGGPDEELKDFVSVVLADTEDTWSRLFAQGGSSYRAPRLVLFYDLVESACGFGEAAMGPFYCPADRSVYLDLGFFREMSERFGAPGDFAAAYVVAHEIGHHVQNLLGVSDQVLAAQARARDAQASNALSVRLELQADCLAGVWGHHAAAGRDLLEPGDVEEGLRAAAAIGDDRIQRMAGGGVSPESWTHGSSAQRAEWLRRGLRDGSVESCDTFSAGR